jgi:uncharacterized membrane protein (UPF0127 family)
MAWRRLAPSFNSFLKLVDGMPFRSSQWLLVAGIVFLVASVFLVAFFLLAPNQETQDSGGAVQQAIVPRACFENGSCLDLELARSDEERARGLMLRESLSSSAGMLFLFESDEIHSFWMKNTLIPLDMIWLDAGGRIIGFQENALPCMETLCPLFSIAFPSRMVLETNAGFISENNVQLGQLVLLQNVPA